MIAASLALISLGALIRVIARRRSCTHRPRLLELVEKIESPPPEPEWSRPVPTPDPPARVDLRVLEHRTWNIPSGHAPSANDYARAVGMPTPGAGTKRRG